MGVCGVSVKLRAVCDGWNDEERMITGVDSMHDPHKLYEGSDGSVWIRLENEAMAVI